MIKGILIGIVIGWFLSFIYGWNRREHFEHKSFKRGVELGKRFSRVDFDAESRAALAEMRIHRDLKRF